MSWVPLLNNEPHTFTMEDLPALIHGEEHSGASLFTISLLAQLYQQGEPILFLSAYSKAKDAFLAQAHDNVDIVTITTEEQLTNADEHQVIHLVIEDEHLLPNLLSQLSDFSERVVLIKNFELFSLETIKRLFEHPFTIYSGDLNSSSAKEPLLQLKYNAKIFFSPLHNDFRLTLPDLEKYHGYYQGRISQGTVSLQEVNNPVS